MTGRINLFRSAVTRTLKSAMPTVRSAEAQFGRFDLDELDRTSFVTPALRISVLSVKAPSRAAGTMDAVMQCAAFVVTDGKARDEQAWDMAEAIAAMLHPGQMFGLVRVTGPSSVAIQPVISSAIRNRGIAIIAVEWSQTIREAGAVLFDGAGIMIGGVTINGEPFEPEVGDGQA